MEPSLAVTDGAHWASRDTEGHVELGKGNGAKGLTNAERHFDPQLIRQFFQELALEACGRVRTAGRDCIRLRAVLRPGASLWPHWLPKEADEYEFHGDCERGVLLALISRYKGTVFSVSEVVEVSFDEILPDELFGYTPQVGEQIRASVPVVEHLTLETAIERMPFTVLVPSKMTEAEGVPQVMYHPARLESPRAHLCLLYAGGSDQLLMIDEAADADPELQDYEWEELSSEGLELRISDPGPGPGVRIVALQRHGTHVAIRSELERQPLIDLATSLIPARERFGR